MVGYRPSAVCERGHVLGVEVGSYTLDEAPRFCPDDGATVIKQCGVCAEPIQSRAPAERLNGFEQARRARDFVAPMFCTNCSGPFPWADRQTRIDEIRNRLSPGLDDATRLALNEQLDRLAAEDISDRDALGVLKRVSALVPDIWTKENVRPIVMSVATAWVLKELGLK